MTVIQYSTNIDLTELILYKIKVKQLEQELQ